MTFVRCLDTITKAIKKCSYQHFLTLAWCSASREFPFQFHQSMSQRALLRLHSHRCFSTAIDFSDWLSHVKFRLFGIQFQSRKNYWFSTRQFRCHAKLNESGLKLFTNPLSNWLFFYSFAIKLLVSSSFKHIFFIAISNDTVSIHFFRNNLSACYGLYRKISIYAWLKVLDKKNLSDLQNSLFFCVNEIPRKSTRLTKKSLNDSIWLLSLSFYFTLKTSLAHIQKIEVDENEEIEYHRIMLGYL